MLIGFTNQHGSREYMHELRDLNDKVSKRAVLGISGIKKVLLTGYNKLSGKGTKAIPFDIKEKTLAYWVSSTKTSSLIG